MDEVGDERVLRVVEGGAALPSCPTCGEPVSGYEAATRTEWALKDAFRGVVGLPVGPEFGRAVPGRTHLRVEPCGHGVDRIEHLFPA